MPNCCVFGCNNNLKNSNVTLHTFPRQNKEPARYKAWKNKINRKNFYPNHNHVVCSIHFKEEDFENRYKRDLLPTEKVVIKLSNTAVPSLLLSGANTNVKRRSRYLRKKIVAKSEKEFMQSNTSLKNEMIVEDFVQNTTLPTTEDIGVQCELGSEVFYKYSTLFEDNSTDDQSVTSFDFSCSERSDNESEFSENEDSDNEEETYENNCELKSSPAEVVLVEIKCLTKLFKCCCECGSSLTEKKQFVRDAVLYINCACSEGHSYQWSSWENPSKCSIHLSAALLLNGINFAAFSNFVETLNLLFLSHTTYYTIIKYNIAPVIQDFWLKHREENYAAAKSESELWISGDGLYDSPGYSAKYVTYSVMNAKSNKILNFSLLQRGMVEGDLEQAACEKILVEIIPELPIKLFLSDMHRGVGLILKRKYPTIRHEFDVWHLSKSLTKKLSKVEKKSKILSEWNRAITNHLWWSLKTSCGNSDVLVQKFTSILKHVCNIHEWTDDSGNKIHCEHRPYTEEEQEQIKWIRYGSTEFQALKTEITNKTFLNDLRHASHYCHTNALESYHNVRLKYIPKRSHFSYTGMHVRSILAILDHNYNIDGEIIRGKANFSKANKQWHYKNKNAKKNNAWKMELLQKVLNSDSKTESLQELHSQVPKNISESEKPLLIEAKSKHCSRFKNSKSK